MQNWFRVEPFRRCQRFLPVLRELLDRRLIAAAALGVVAVWWLSWLSRPFLLLGPLGYVKANEMGDAVYPQVAYIVRLLRSGQFSLWLPSQAGGTDLLGNFNSPILNVILYAAFPPWLGNNLIFLFITAAASISTYIALRRSFNCAMWSACLGAAACSTWFLYAGMVFGYAAGPCYALAPLVLHVLLSARGWSAREAWASAALGLAYALGGHFSWSVFILGTAGCCALLLAARRVHRWLPHLVLMVLIVAAVQWPFVLANVQTSEFSGRAYYGPYYYILGIPSMMGSYILTNPTPAPFFKMLAAASAIAAAAVIFAPARWEMAKRAWPVWGLSALFVFLPVIDIANIYILSVFEIGGYSVDAIGGFGGPMDSRLRHARSFIGGLAIGLAADLLWRSGQFSVTQYIASFKLRRHALQVRLGAFHVLLRTASEAAESIVQRGQMIAASIEWDSRKVATSITQRGRVGTASITWGGHMVFVSCTWGDRLYKAAIKWRGRIVSSWARTLPPLFRLAAVTAIFVAAMSTVVGWLGAVRDDIREKRSMALNGVNFSSFYAHPELRALAAANPAFGTYRVATVALLGSDSDFSGPWHEPRDPSLFAPFQNAYGFETADGYMSNLTRRSMNYWNWLILGAPDFNADGRHPRTQFYENYTKKFAHYEQAFSQKLYLFEPLNSKTFDPDGCIRTTTPINFSAYYNLDMLSLANAAFVISAIPLSDPRLTLLESSTREELRRLQCASHAERRKAFRRKGLMGRPLYVYRNSEVLPRVFAPRGAVAVADELAMLETVTRRSARELAEKAIVVQSEVPGLVEDLAKDRRVEIGRMETVRGDHLRIQARSGAGGLVVVADSFSPHWRASAGGTDLRVFPVYHTFIGIWVPPGEHTVELRYRPPYARLLGYGAQ